MDNPAFDRIADSTDWLTTALPSFTQLEAALRCQVCKDFFDTPMMTSCSHTFCSLCIRRCFAADGKCPTCRAEDQDSKLRRNWSAQELVDVFQAARPRALQLAKGASGCESSDQAGAKGKTGVKRKLEHGDPDGDDDDGVTRPARKTRSQTRRVPSSSQATEVIDLIEDDENATEEEVPASDGLVACPSCNRRMKEEAVFSHLDRCDGQDTSRSTRSRAATSTVHPLQQSRDSPASSKNSEPPTRLPQLNYQLMNNKELRKRLAEHGIPTSGTRTQLIRRHIEWANLWNANVDSLRPRSKKALLSELDKWDRSQAAEGGGLLGKDHGAQVMKKDFDGEEWAKSNKSQFDTLIAEARKKSQQSKQRKDEESENMKNQSSKEESPANNADSRVSTPDRSARAYEVHQDALDKVRAKVQEANKGTAAYQDHSNTINEPQNNAATSTLNKQHSNSQPGSGGKRQPVSTLPSSLPGRLASPQKGARKKNMFEVPSEPIMDVDTEAHGQ